jgi:hypothetical protein
MDDTQRLAVTGLGGGFMGAALTWIAAISLSSHPSPWRYAPPAVLFLVGAALFIWAMRSGDPARAALDRRAAELERAIEDGHALLDMERPLTQNREWNLWDDRITAMLREHWGLQAVADFDRALHTHGERSRIIAQIGVLEGLHVRPPRPP